MLILAQIFLIFAKVGALTFGGGYSMLPIMRRDVVDRRGWVTDADLTDSYALAQCLPGLIAVNTSVFVGHRRKGIAGGIAAALGVLFPSIVVIVAISALITNFAEIEAVGHAFAGIRVCVFVLILNTVIKLWKGAVVDRPALVIFLAVFLVSVFTSVSVVLIIVAAGAVGLAVSYIREGAQQR